MPSIIPRSEWGATRRGGWSLRPLPATEVWAHYPGAADPPGPDATFAQDAACVRSFSKCSLSTISTISAACNQTEAVIYYRISGELCSRPANRPQLWRYNNIKSGSFPAFASIAPLAKQLALNYQLEC